MLNGCEALLLIGGILHLVVRRDEVRRGDVWVHCAMLLRNVDVVYCIVKAHLGHAVRILHLLRR